MIKLTKDQRDRSQSLLGTIRKSLAAESVVSVAVLGSPAKNVSADTPPRTPAPLAALSKTAAQRSTNTLPINAYGSHILQTIAESTVTLIRGETGSGKSTQVPKIILQDAAERGVPCGILVTQPRRLAAIALADRVSQELGDEKGAGGVCGYRIRGEANVNKRGVSTSVTFATTGILLRQLLGGSTKGGRLQGVTHLIIDEVHERTMDVDLVLMALRRAVVAAASSSSSSSSSWQPPKIILMSATLDTAALTAYFSQGWSAGANAKHGSKVNVVSVPGRVFPVEALYLEDAVLHCPRFQCTEGDLLYGRGGGGKQTLPLGPALTLRAEAAEAAAKAAEAAREASNEGSGVSTTQAGNLSREASRLERVAASFGQGPVGTPGTEWLCALGETGLARHLLASAATSPTATAPKPTTTAGRSGGGGDGLPLPVLACARSLRAMALDKINYDLIAALLLRHHDNQTNKKKQSDRGAALVFLPGVFELRQAEEALTQSGALMGQRSPFWVVSLHSQAPLSEQRRAFATGADVPAGLTKVVLATDIAETSLTIPDVTLVVDSGLHRTTSVTDHGGGGAGTTHQHLGTGRVSKATATQRRGRAGRVQAGTCYHLFLKAEVESCEAQPLPEVLRAPLEGFVLKAAGLLGSFDPAQPASPTTTTMTTAMRAQAAPTDRDEKEEGKGGSVSLASSVLAASPNPPSEAAVSRAVHSLQRMGALHVFNGDGNGGGGCGAVTRLGELLAALPVEPKLALSLAYAATFGCLSNTAFAVACLSAPRLPFLKPSDTATTASTSSTSSTLFELDRTSDLLAALRAKAVWEAAKKAGGKGAAVAAVATATSSLPLDLPNCIDGVAMASIVQTQKLLVQEVTRALQQTTTTIRSGSNVSLSSLLDARAEDMALVRACVSVACHVMEVLPSSPSASSSSSSRSRSSGARKQKPPQLRWQQQQQQQQQRMPSGGKAKQKRPTDLFLAPHPSSLLASAGAISLLQALNVKSTKPPSSSAAPTAKKKGSLPASPQPLAPHEAPSAVRLCACHKIFSTPNSGGLQALDTTRISPLLAYLFQHDDDGGEDGHNDDQKILKVDTAAEPRKNTTMAAAAAVQWDAMDTTTATATATAAAPPLLFVEGIGQVVTVAAEADARVVAALRQVIRRVVRALGVATSTSTESFLHGGAGGGGGTQQRLPSAAASSSSWLQDLRSLVSGLLHQSADGSPWASVPEGWSFEFDGSGAALYRSLVPGVPAVRAKPTEAALVVARRAAAAKAQFELYKVQGFGGGSAAFKTPPLQTATPPLPPLRALDGTETGHQPGSGSQSDVLGKSETNAAAAAAAAAAGGAADREDKALANKSEAAAEERQRVSEAAAAAAVAAAAAREVVLARAKAMAASREEDEERKSTAWSVRKGLGALLKELDMAQAASSFQAAGFGDEQLEALAEAIDEGGACGEGIKAFEEMAKRVGLKGGSVARLKKRLLEPNAKVPKPNGVSPKPGGGKGGKGGGGKGKGGKVDDAAKLAAAAAEKEAKAKSKAKAKAKANEFVMPTDGKKKK